MKAGLSSGASEGVVLASLPGCPNAGPFRTDSVAYVFGGERPAGNANHGAGIDVSPAVHDCLGLRPVDLVDWRFIEQAEVPTGPWSLYDRLENPRPSR